MTDPVGLAAREGSGGVLVVEDEGLVAMFIEDILEDLGLPCCGTAATAAEALDLAERHRPSAALVDIGLRGNRDGIALAEELTGRLGITVVFLTGATDDATLERARATGAHGFLGKPCTEPEIAEIVRSALDAATAGDRPGTA
ncbi:response regulator [Marinibaculum pumilum]|uniref:Response regulator n=1 Tax=Marinibaculum pumilum TaxID=1766165 RepID=A0ABV7L7H5_9PROT